MEKETLRLLEYILHSYSSCNRIFNPTDLDKLGMTITSLENLGDAINSIEVYPMVTDNGIVESFYLLKKKTIIICLGNILVKYYYGNEINYKEILRLNMYILYNLLLQIEKARKLKMADGTLITLEEKLLNMGKELENKENNYQSNMAIKEVLKIVSYCLSMRDNNPIIRLSEIDAKLNMASIISSNNLNVYYEATIRDIIRSLRRGYNKLTPTEQFISYYEALMGSEAIIPNIYYTDNYTLEESLRLGLPPIQEYAKEKINVERILRK